MGTGLKTIQINELFTSAIQGEGLDIGKPCIFVRTQHCPVKCPGCFTKATQIRMADFSTKSIADIKEGDEVLSYGVKSGRFVPRRVVHTMVHHVREVYRIRTTKDTATFVTGEHPLLVRGRGWVEVKDLRIGDRILYLSMSELRSLHNPMRDPEVVKRMQRTTKALNLPSVFDRLSPQKQLEWRERASVRMLASNPMKNPATAIKGFLNRKDRGKKSEVEHFVERVGRRFGIKFVGDGSLVVNNLVPDFIIPGTKKLVEVWPADQTERRMRGKRWRTKRRALFKEAGYDVLFLPVTPSKPNPRLEKTKLARKTEVRRIRTKLAEYVHNGATVIELTKLTPRKHTKTWVRLAGTMDDTLPVYNFEVQGTHTYVADSLVAHNCDTAHSWDGSETGTKQPLGELNAWVLKALVKAPRCGIILSGGEPLLHYANKDFCNLLAAWKTITWVSLETSGFIGPKPLHAPEQRNQLRDFLRCFTTVHLSPKITPCLHGEGWTDEELTCNVPYILDAVLSYIGLYGERPNLAFKFVVRDDADVKAVEDFVAASRIREWQFPIFLMPYGQEPDEIIETCRRMVPHCVRTGYILSPRLHSIMFGKKRGV